MIPALGEIRERYGNEAEFAADLAANGLSQAALEAAVRRGLPVDAVLERVSAQAPAVSDVVESPLGFHVLPCDAILAPGAMPLADALPRVSAMHFGNCPRGIQRAWLRQLLSGDRAPACPAPESNVG